MKKRSPVAADDQHGAFRLIEFTLPTPLCRKLDARAQKRVESRLRTIISEQIIYSTIKLKVPTHEATRIIKENHQSIITHLEKAKKIMQGESFISSFPMIGYANTTEERAAWIRFPDDLGRVIGIYQKSLARSFFPTKGWAKAKAAADVEGVLLEEGVKPALSNTGIWAKVTKYVIESATGESVSKDTVINAMRLARSLSAKQERTECNNHEKQR